MSAAIPPPGAGVPPPAAGVAPAGAAPPGAVSNQLTPEQSAVVQIVLADPLIMQAITEALTGEGTGGGGGIDQTLATAQSPAAAGPTPGQLNADESLEKRLLGA